jgi:hypothetical protein
MTWLLALVLRPVGAFAVFGFALLLARVLWPLIPAGRLRAVLYDRNIKKNHPWKFALLGMTACYGTAFLVWLWVYRWS